MEEGNNFSLIATVLFPTWTNARYDYEIGQWKRTGGNPAVSTFSTILNINPVNTTTENNVIEIIEDLNCTLLAFYINDFAPKKIYQFHFEGVGAGHPSIQLSSLLGTGQVLPEETIEQIAVKSFNRSTFFTPKEFFDINYEIPKVELVSWYSFFKEHKEIARGLMLIQEGYGYLHSLFNESHRKYFDQYIFRSAILLIVSGLESIFLKHDENELKFKFSLVGATMYQKYVTKDYFSSFDNHTLSKLQPSDIFDILNSLYSIRNNVAHGSYNFLDRKMKIIVEKLNVAISPDQSQFRQHSLLALNILQVHLLGIIKCTKENLIKGPEILRENI